MERKDSKLQCHDVENRKMKEEFKEEVLPKPKLEKDTWRNKAKELRSQLLELKIDGDLLQHIKAEMESLEGKVGKLRSQTNRFKLLQIRVASMKIQADDDDDEADDDDDVMKRRMVLSDARKKGYVC